MTSSRRKADRPASTSSAQRQTAGQPFDFVITDLGMPYVDGRQVASAIKGMSKSTQVVLLTGWGRRMNAAGEMPECVDHLLGKPPKLDELRATLGTYRA